MDDQLRNAAVKGLGSVASMKRMTPPIHCHIRLARLGPTTRNILAGLAILARQGVVKLTQEMAPRPANRSDGPMHLRDKASWLMHMVVNGRQRACFDMQHGSEIDIAAYQECDVYFKRALDRSAVPPDFNAKLRPFGLVHDVFLPFDTFALRRKMHLDASMRDRAIEVVRWAKRPIAWSFGRGDRLNLADCTAAPFWHVAPRVLYLTTLIDPSAYRATDPGGAADYDALNEMRAQCVRMLRNEFGPKFTGGVADSEFARRIAPDTIVQEPHMMKAHRFVELARDHAVCVATSGPRRAPGFELAAYAALSRAVVAQAFVVELPGDFRADANFLPFTTPEQCVEQTWRLVADSARIRAQMRTNWAYYNTWIRPDAFALRIIDETLECA